MYLYFIEYKFSEVSFYYFLIRLYSEEWVIAYWYLYAYLAFLIILPIMQKIAKVLDNKDYNYILFVYLFIQCVKIAEFLIWKGEVTYNSSFSVFILEQTVIYPFMGYFLEHRLQPKDYNKRTALSLILLSVLCIAICCMLTHYVCVLNNEWSEKTCQTFFNSLIIIPSMSVYYWVKCIMEKCKLSNKTKRILSVVGSCTFGIYLFERIYRDVTIGIYSILESLIPSILACFIWIFISCVMGLFVTMILKRIPIINRFI